VEAEAGSPDATGRGVTRGKWSFHIPTTEKCDEYICIFNTVIALATGNSTHFISSLLLKFASLHTTRSFRRQVTSHIHLTLLPVVSSPYTTLHIPPQPSHVMTLQPCNVSPMPLRVLTQSPAKTVRRVTAAVITRFPLQCNAASLRAGLVLLEWSCVLVLRAVAGWGGCCVTVVCI
jgi:hypothetical protein